VPTYEYVCQSCGTHVEVHQRFSDESLTQCGVCGGPLRKVFHPAGILFRGSGFYVTDSRSKRSGAGGEGKTKGKERSSAGEAKAPEKSPSSRGGRESRGSESRGRESRGSESRGSESRGDESGAAKSASRSDKERSA
jgi:putative FmdB family regulatory protein